MRRPPWPPPLPPPLQSSNLVTRLLDGCCFPALSVLRHREQFLTYWALMNQQADQAADAAAAASAEGGAGSPAAVQAAAQAAHGRQMAAQLGNLAKATWEQCEKCVLAARLQAASSAGGSSREAAFELLQDLVTHDLGCWQKAAEHLQNSVHATGAGLLLLPFNNVPLQLVRAPK